MARTGDCVIEACERLHGYPTPVLCICFFVLQSAIMDYYLIEHLSLSHLAWMAVDVVNLTVLITCLFFIHPLVKVRKSQPVMRSIAWISWLLMSAIIAAKTITIFTQFASELEEEAPSFFGPNTMKTSIALGSIVFLMLLLSQHEEPPGSEARHYIEELTGTVVFDLLDTVDILEVLFDDDGKESLLDGVQELILAVATINLIIPTVPLFTLSKTKFGSEKMQKRLVYLHRLLLVLAINVPNLIVRMILWHGCSVGISPFILKNIILICMTLFEFYEHKQEKYEQHKEEAEMESKGAFTKPSSSNGSPLESQDGSKKGVEGFENRNSPNRARNSLGSDHAESYGDFPIEERMVTSI